MMTMIKQMLRRFVVCLVILQGREAFQVIPDGRRRNPNVSSQKICLRAKAGEGDGGGGVEEYKNALTSVLSNFMSNPKDVESSENDEDNLLSKIHFDAPKIPIRNLEVLAQTLDAELFEKEWFVTGNVNPCYFSDDFEFQDPDVKLSGIEDYAKGVNKLFDQETSRAEIISSVVNSTVPNTITVTWRLSGKVNIGPGLNIKPYICYTDFTVRDGLIVFQEDRFDIPGWDILLSSLFPFLIGKLTAPAAPPVEPRRKPKLPKQASPLDVFEKLFQQQERA
jgi:hypothetical protein